MENECVFCKIVKGEISTKIIYENDNFFSMLDQNQKHKGHSLVIPKKHFETVLDLPNTLGSELVECIKKTALILMKDYDSTGFNVLSNNFESAEQYVKHVHFHIFPRKEGDNVKIYQ